MRTERLDFVPQLLVPDTKIIDLLARAIILQDALLLAKSQCSHWGMYAASIQDRLMI